MADVAVACRRGIDEIRRWWWSDFERWVRRFNVIYGGVKHG